MELLNRTSLVAAMQTQTTAQGHLLLVLIAKASYAIRAEDQEPALLDEQVPLHLEDTFEGEPGLSSPRYEADLAPMKPRCDVLVTGCAHAPGGRPAAQVPVGVAIGLGAGAFSKTFAVQGPRQWQRGLLGSLRPGPAEPFVRQALHYGLAYGGSDCTGPDAARHAVCAVNPVGVGFNRERDAKAIEGTPVAQTEAFAHPITDAWALYPSLSLGPVGRNWQPRLALAGTHDAEWQRDRFPLPPADFDIAHNQSAPADQQIEHLRSGDPVTLVNLTANGHTRFTLPDLRLHGVAHGRQGRKPRAMVPDTLLLEPELGRFSVVWRASWPLHGGDHMSALELRRGDLHG